MFCQGASDLWGTERVQRVFFALPGLLDGSWASPGAPSCALWPLWACLARRPVLFGRLLDALGRPTWPLNCQTAVQKPCQVAPSADFHASNGQISRFFCTRPLECAAFLEERVIYEKPKKTIGFYRFSVRLLSLSPVLPNLEKTMKNAVLSSNFEVRAVLHSKRSWTPLGGLLGANLDVLGVHLAALVTLLGPTWTLLGPT